MKRFRPEDGRPPRSQDEILERIYRRGVALRLRRQIFQVGAAITALVMVASAAFVASNDAAPRGIKIIDPSPSGEPTVGLTDDPTPETPSPSASPTDSDPSPTLVCHNSTDPACGTFYWDPAPGPNAGLEFEIQISPANPRVGDEVTATVTVRDPDSPVTEIYVNFDIAMQMAVDCAPSERYGPWAPPPKAAGEKTETASKIFNASGPHVVYILAFSQGASCDGSPYGNRGESQRTFTIEVDPTPTPSPTDAETPLPTPSTHIDREKN